MRILLQNLTRFGDLLQSQPTLAELAGAGHEVAVACLENFAGAAALLPEASALFPLPGARFLAELDRDWHQALVAISEYADHVSQQFAPDAIINLTPALAARLLARRLHGDAVQGFSLDPLGYRHESSLWATFLEASSTRRGLSPFNIVDLFRKAAGGGQGRGQFCLRRPDAQEQAESRSRLEGQAPAATTFFVGFQLGASAAARQWPVDFFARLGELLWEQLGAVPVLLGGAGEKALAMRYRDLCAAPSVDLIGETTLSQLAAVLCQLRLLVTNDTGTMHLAAGLDIPCAAVFLATAQPFDTGPYREGCLCLEPDMPCHPCPFGTACPHDNACLTAIGVETMFASVADFCQNGRFPAGCYPGARAWLSAFDASGFMDLYSLSGHDAEPRAAWLRLERQVLRQFLDEEPLHLATTAVPVLPEALRESLRGILGQSADLLRLLEGQAVLAARTPAMKSRFLASWERLRTLWLHSPYLGVLAYLWMQEAQEAAPDLERLLTRIRRFGSCVEILTVSVHRMC